MVYKEYKRNMKICEILNTYPGKYLVYIKSILDVITDIDNYFINHTTSDYFVKIDTYSLNSFPYRIVIKTNNETDEIIYVTYPVINSLDLQNIGEYDMIDVNNIIRDALIDTLGINRGFILSEKISKRYK
jgi:hypothetical protein